MYLITPKKGIIDYHTIGDFQLIHHLFVNIKILSILIRVKTLLKYEMLCTDVGICVAYHSF